MAEVATWSYEFNTAVDPDTGLTIEKRPTLKEGTPAADYWQYGLEKTELDLVQKHFTMYLSRSKLYPGVAHIGPGKHVHAKLAFSPADSPTILASYEYEIFWSGEYAGKGAGNLYQAPKAHHEGGVMVGLQALAFTMFAVATLA